MLAYVSTVLKEAGYKVGRYISPTIFSYRERIQVNESYISREELIRLTEKVKAAGDQLLAEGRQHPTMFEMETAIAFLYFAEQNCDLVVLEVGMGGRSGCDKCDQEYEGGCTGIHQYGSYGISWKYAGRDC